MLLLCRDVAAPFNAWHEVNDAVFAQCARNHVEYGLKATAFYATLGNTLAPPPVPPRYLSHPPLLAIWTAVSIQLFGDHEWSARLVPIAATVGSTALLMAILGRLGQPFLGVLAGFFFATLPLSTYFGRMVCHEAPTQLFSLLMLHGYLAWAGDYGVAETPWLGPLAFTAGAVLGIGTGWAAVVAAGLLWAWHAWRVVHRAAEGRLLLWLTLVPGLALATVVLHIVAGWGWDAGALGALLDARSVGGAGGQVSSAAWLRMQGLYFVRNYTWPGALATLLVCTVLPFAWLRARRDGASSRFVPPAGPVKVAAFSGVQGLLWLLGLKNQAWFHDYWQFFLAPGVALCLAGVTVAVRDLVASRVPRLSGVTVVLLLATPMPFAAASRDFYAAHRLVDPELIHALSEAGRLLPHRAPIWTSHRATESTETIGGREYSWTNPILAYYANRPLLFSRDAVEVRKNAPGCVAYLLKRSDQAWARDLEATLSRSFDAVPVGEQHVLFRLDRPGRAALPP